MSVCVESVSKARMPDMESMLVYMAEVSAAKILAPVRMMSVFVSLIRLVEFLIYEGKIFKLSSSFIYISSHFEKNAGKLLTQLTIGLSFIGFL